MRRRDILVLFGGSAAAGMAGSIGGDGADDTEDGSPDSGSDGESGGDEPTPATFGVSELDPPNLTADPGVVITVSAQITNTGDEGATKTVELRVDGEAIADREMELAAGASDAVSFEVETATLSAGDHPYSVRTEDGEAQGTLTLREATPATFEVADLDPTETRAAVGDVLSVTAEITNTGDQNQDGEVEFRLNGETLTTNAVGLDAGESETITFEPSIPDLAVGDYAYSVRTADDEAEGSLTLVEALGTVELSAVDSDGNRIEGATVRGPSGDTETDASGGATLELEPGNYDLTVSFRGVERQVSVDVVADETTTLTVEFDADAIAIDIASFAAENTGGFIAFDEDSRATAEEEGVAFPAGEVVIEGAVSEGAWESTNVSFAVLDAGVAEAEVEAPSGLAGRFDYENELMTVEGTLDVTTAGDTFSFEIAATTGDSGELSGDASFEPEGGTALLVDNEYVVEDETGGLVDSVLGLPVEEPGRCWLELPLSFDFEQ